MNLDTILDKTIDLVSTWGIKVVGVLVALFIAWLVAGWASRAALKRFEKHKFDSTLSRFQQGSRGVDKSSST